MAIYAFNLAYPKNFEKTLLFFQRIILSLDDEQPLDKKYYMLHPCSIKKWKVNFHCVWTVIKSDLTISVCMLLFEN